MFHNFSEEWKIFLSLCFGLLFSYILTKCWIKWEKNRGIQQVIREEMVTKNLKEHTPTMGGTAFFLASVLSLILVDPFLVHDKHLQWVLLFSTGFLFIGFFDDFLKIKRKNTKGIPATIRIFLEIALSIAFLYFGPFRYSSEWFFHLPHFQIFLGEFFILFVPIVILGATNAVNLSDGMDGLLGFLYLFALLPILLSSLLQHEVALSVYFCALYGSVCSFMRFNIHPAKIFMGDSGSLFLGAVFSFSSFLLHIEFLLPIAGILFVFEAISVILQVISFHIRGKRIFLMTPLHHHFEMKGVKEWKVVMIFALIGFLASLISILLIL